jgi:hypothetical protein
MNASSWRLGCDIGGTFTDFVLLDETTGAFTVEKVLTTPADPSEAVDDGVVKLLARHPGFVAATEHVIHGTTLIINAVIERGRADHDRHRFADILGCGARSATTSDIGAVYPTPLVERNARREVTERVGSDGGVLTPLDEADAARVLAALAAEGVGSSPSAATPTPTPRTGGPSSAWPPHLAQRCRSRPVLPRSRSSSARPRRDERVRQPLWPATERLEGRLAARGPPPVHDTLRQRHHGHGDGAKFPCGHRVARGRAGGRASAGGPGWATCSRSTWAARRRRRASSAAARCPSPPSWKWTASTASSAAAAPRSACPPWTSSRSARAAAPSRA